MLVKNFKIEYSNIIRLLETTNSKIDGSDLEQVFVGSFRSLANALSEDFGVSQVGLVLEGSYQDNGPPLAIDIVTQDEARVSLVLGVQSLDSVCHIISIASRVRY